MSRLVLSARHEALIGLLRKRKGMVISWRKASRSGLSKELVLVSPEWPAPRPLDGRVAGAIEYRDLVNHGVLKETTWRDNGYTKVAYTMKESLQ